MANNWIELNGKKEPPPDKPLTLWIPDDNYGEKGYYTKGILSKIEFKGTAKIYVFEEMDEDGAMLTPSHFMIIEPPKNNQ